MQKEIIIGLSYFVLLDYTLLSGTNVFFGEISENVSTSDQGIAEER